MLLDILKKIFGFKDNTVEIIQGNGCSSNGPFIMTVDDVVSITGLGVVITGKIESGMVKIGDNIKIAQSGKISKVTRIVKMSEKNVKHAQLGEAVGLILQGISEFDIQKGWVLEGLN